MILQGDLASYPSDSPMQQEAVWAVAATDAYQWGYDPVHYGVPEGSYSTDPDGPARILEYRCPRDTHSFCVSCVRCTHVEPTCTKASLNLFFSNSNRWIDFDL